jgi:predicted O-linked N-acetylglucosamine transferase (SPINDLY family)
MPREAQVPLNLGIVNREMGKPDEGIAYFRQALALRPSWVEAWSNLLFSLSFAEKVTPEVYLREALTFGRVACEAVRPYTEWSIDATPGTPLRVGFVSGDLRSHPVGYFLEGVLAHVDPARVRLYAYSTRSIEDALTARIKPRFAVWRTLVGLNDEQAARAIHDDGIQVLLDLSGHTDSNRLPVFAWKPAPVQASWIGYFASTGLAAIDYVLGDEWVLPPDEASHFVERPWRLPHGYLCFTPPEPPVEIDASRREADAAPTFGYLGDFSKVNDRVAAVWAKILSRVSGSKLFLKAFQFGNEAEREAARARFAALGIGAERLVLEGPSPRAEYLAAYNCLDLVLSPFPYPGGTTTAESLWMGVPVLCKRGDRFLGHLCESVVRSVGLDDWIAADEDDYVAKAIGFVQDRRALAALTGTLRARVLASSLTDAPRFARTLEDAFAAMWRSYESAA